MTLQRKVVLDVVESSYNHLTAEQVYEEAKRRLPDIAVATVYNNLNALTGYSMIRRLHTPGGPDRYDRIEPHDHIVCEKCGKLEDVGCVLDVKKLSRRLKRNVGSYELYLSGVCRDCLSGVQSGSK